jgi:hypothetical protein
VTRVEGQDHLTFKAHRTSEPDQPTNPPLAGAGA